MPGVRGRKILSRKAPGTAKSKTPEYWREWARTHKESWTAAQRRYKKSPHGKRKWNDWHRLSTYGLTAEAYDAMVIASCGRCAVCDLPAELVVDHNHQTSEVRGLLCSPCNQIMGYVEKRYQGTDWLRKAAGYLNREIERS